MEKKFEMQHLSRIYEINSLVFEILSQEKFRETVSNLVSGDVLRISAEHSDSSIKLTLCIKVD